MSTEEETNTIDCIPTEPTIDIVCANGCGCKAIVPEENWIKHLVDTNNTLHGEGGWMVVVHGMHMHMIPLCYVQCMMGYFYKEMILR